MTTLVDEFVPALPGGWSMAGMVQLGLLNHETAHGVAAVVAGLTVKEVRIDRPDIGKDGVVAIVPDFDRLEGHLVAVLCGPIAHGMETPSWPPAEMTGDEGVCAILVGLLGYDEGAWDAAVADARALLKRPDVVRARHALADALILKGAVRGDRVAQIVTEGLGDRVGG